MLVSALSSAQRKEGAWQGIPVFNAQLQININREGHILSVNNSFVPMLARSVNLVDPSLVATDAVLRAAAHLKLPVAAPPRAVKQSQGITRDTTVSNAGISLAPIEARLQRFEGAVNAINEYETDIGTVERETILCAVYEIGAIVGLDPSTEFAEQWRGRSLPLRQSGPRDPGQSDQGHGRAPARHHLRAAQDGSP